MRYIFFIGIIFLCSCNSRSKDAIAINEYDIQTTCLQNLTDVIVYDIFSPPVASRIYAYANIAFYEAIKHEQESAKSITAILKEFKSMPVPDARNVYNFKISAIAAFFKVSKTLCFSKDSVQQKYDRLLLAFKKSTNERVYKTSITFGDAIANAVLERASIDNYKYIKGLPKYNVTKVKGVWEQTPPDYMDAIEPNWQLLKPMLLDSAGVFVCPKPPTYNEDKTSVYYKEMMEVVTMHKLRTKTMDSIARYWDDNPFVTEHKGHFTAATKKITPGGHWIGITGIVCKQQKVTLVKTALIFALTSCSIYDGFIACWYEKYKTNMVRPITVIKALIDPTWNAFLQTPPFPEYTSGHSVISSAAATVLAHYLTDSIAFTDTSELNYLGMQRSFTSISEAANEACISRLYGGIHYRTAIEQGKIQGKKIGKLYNVIIK
jgi:hypothetical protein